MLLILVLIVHVEYLTDSIQPVLTNRLNCIGWVFCNWSEPVELVSPVATQEAFFNRLNPTSFVFSVKLVWTIWQLKCNSDLPESHRLVSKYDSPGFRQDCHGAITLTDQPKWFNHYTLLTRLWQPVLVKHVKGKVDIIPMTSTGVHYASCNRFDCISWVPSN